MTHRPTILTVVGSAAANSANEKLCERVEAMLAESVDVVSFRDLKTLPHFDPALSVGEPPPAITAFRKRIEAADGVFVCTPEYIFSVPSGLKNALEWCVATTVFTDKPAGIITASASGEKGHEELQLLLKTLGARLTPETALLIRGIKSKLDEKGALRDEETRTAVERFVAAFVREVTGGYPSV